MFSIKVRDLQKQIDSNIKKIMTESITNVIANTKVPLLSAARELVRKSFTSCPEYQSIVSGNLLADLGIGENGTPNSAEKMAKLTQILIDSMKFEAYKNRLNLVLLP